MNVKEVLGAFLLVNNPIVLSEEETKDVQKAIKQLQQENKILRENAEHNDKVVDKVNWENQLLKKQLEEYKDKINWYENFEINKTIDKLRIKHNNQQKEFIDYLTSYIELLSNKPDLIEESEIDLLKEILSKFKEIIGENNE